VLQQIAFKNLVQRNKRIQQTQGPPPENSSIQLPFIIVNTSKKTVIDCSISNDKWVLTDFLMQIMPGVVHLILILTPTAFELCTDNTFRLVLLLHRLELFLLAVSVLTSRDNNEIVWGLLEHPLVGLNVVTWRTFIVGVECHRTKPGFNERKVVNVADRRCISLNSGLNSVTASQMHSSWVFPTSPSAC